MYDCPQCGNALADNAVICNGCRWEPAKKRSRAGDVALEVRRVFAENAPSSFDLTDQQWYNVCRFFPHVAAKSKRPLTPVGEQNPLHKTSGLGPMFKGISRGPRGPSDIIFDEDAAERAAIQSEGA